MIGAVIVVFNPDYTQLKNVVSLAVKQVDKLIIVNNGMDDLRNELFCHKKIVIVNNNNNLGIGAALNIGLSRLLSAGCVYFLLLDQDSELTPGIVKRLHSSFTAQSEANVAAVGPAYYDQSIGKLSPFVKHNGRFVEHFYGDALHELHECDFIITSGTFTSADVIQDVGFMNEELFIDHVDHEWCLRATSKGYKIIGDSSVTLMHSIGGEPFRFKGRLYHSHSPIRYYYLFRNTVLLYKKDYIPAFWKKFFMKHLLISIIFQGFFSKHKLKKIAYMFKGILHGIRNVSGPYPSK